MFGVTCDSSLNAKAHPGAALVSIIVPCYNCAAFIAHSIESALAQTYSRVEVIVVDDGSTDNSAEIISRYPVQCIRTNREGVSGARNRAIRESGGEFLIFLDADDLLLPHAAQVGVSALLTHPECCMAVGAHNLISSEGHFLRRRDKPVRLRDYYAGLLRSNFIECTSCVVFRRSMVARCQWFSPELNGAEDYDLYLELARQYPIYCHSDVVSEYRIHDGNASRNSEMMLCSTLRVVRSQARYAIGAPYRIYSYLYGFWFWRRKYGRQLTRELVFSSRSKGVTRDRWKALASAYPVGVPIALVGRFLPVQVAAVAFHIRKGTGIPDMHSDPRGAGASSPPNSAAFP